MAIAKHCDGEDTEALSRKIAGSLGVVRSALASAAAEAGRPAGSVSLVAVSKTAPVEVVAAALKAGQLVFGENRVQEAQAKFPALRSTYPGLRLHIIGGLQTNKAADAVAVADVIESLDRPKLADAIERAGERVGRLPELLIQVNVGDEPQKSGVSRAEADAFIDAQRRRFGDRLTGLMCVPPAGQSPGAHFEWLAACAARHGLHVLSMGMSADFELAIAAGATQIRVGSAIFGARLPAGAGSDAAPPSLT